MVEAQAVILDYFPSISLAIMLIRLSSVSLLNGINYITLCPSVYMTVVTASWNAGKLVFHHLYVAFQCCD